MPTTLTTNYLMQKPEVGGDTNQWGYMINEDLNTIDSVLFDSVKKTTGGSPQEMTNVLRVAECPLVGSGGAEMWENRAATVSWVEWRIKTFLDQFLPIGTIMLWGGNPTLMPPGWWICNGQLGTPNMTSRIIMCAGSIANTTPGPYGTPSSFPFDHRHSTKTGAAAGGVPIVQGDDPPLWAGGNTTPPYYAAVFIMKYANWG